MKNYQAFDFLLEKPSEKIALVDFDKNSAQDAKKAEFFVNEFLSKYQFGFSEVL